MAEKNLGKKYKRQYIPNDSKVAAERMKEYDCTRYCRICPYPGLKCCATPVNDLHAK